jgi:hypothetical protein
MVKRDIIAKLTVEMTGAEITLIKNSRRSRQQ